MTVAHEHPCPVDAEHRAMRRLGLTVASCRGRGCENLRDLGLIARQPFGRENDVALDAIDRVNLRSGTGVAS